jgi:hypothetical protein
VIPIESSAIAAVDYDAGARRLEVRFVSGACYAYLGVPAEAYAALIAAPSKGAFFVAHVRDAYPFERLQ